MSNAAKSSTALLSTHSSSSSENDNLEAAQETVQQLALLQHDSEEEDINDELHEENNDETTKLSEYHAKNYFNSTVDGKDVQVLFAMAIGCHMRNIPSHKDPPFSKSKVKWSRLFLIGNDLDQDAECSITLMTMTMTNKLNTKFMSLLMVRTESLSFANAQPMCYTCGILHTNMTSSILSDNNYDQNQVLMVMPDQVWMQPNL